MSNQFLSQGIAGLGSANSQIGNVIQQALKTYQDNNAYYNYNQASMGTDYGGWGAGYSGGYGSDNYYGGWDVY
jgi:hypothetical protein